MANFIRTSEHGGFEVQEYNGKWSLCSAWEGKDGTVRVNWGKRQNGKDQYAEKATPIKVDHLGDFRLSTDGPNVHELIGMLNGNHVFIAGNHDRKNGLNTPLQFAVIKAFGRQIVLAHRPEDCNFIMGLLGIDLGFCGHVHEKWKFKTVEHGDLINVGVDQWDYYPIDGRQIFKAYKNWLRDGKGNTEISPNFGQGGTNGREGVSVMAETKESGKEREI
jgi:calcineurin-like phosphoesterase family protein